MTVCESCGTHCVKSPERIAQIKKPRAINSGAFFWSLPQPLLRQLLQTYQPEMAGVPADASKIPARRFNGERRLFYLTTPTKALTHR